MGAAPAGVTTEPDPAHTSATPAPTADDFRSIDRQFGWLVVNRWTYRVLRALMGVASPTPELSGVEVEEVATAGQGLRVVRPSTVTGSGAVLLVHGGGFVIGSNQDVLGKAALLARRCGVPVVCPGYRLAPEHPFPAALDDCHAAWTWLQEQAPALGVDPERVVVGGYSAGAGLAAGLVQRLHDEGGGQPSGQLLVYPMLDDRTAAARALDRRRHRVWSNRNNRFGWTGLLGHPPGQESPAPYAVPARRDDLAGLPPAWVGVGTADLFLDEDRAYAARLAEAGVEVTYREVAGGIHGFDMVEESPLTVAFEESIVAFVRGRAS